MMDNFVYAGESLWVGSIGKILVLLTFVGAFFSFISYFLAVKNRTSSPSTASSWKSLGRIGFHIHGISLLTIVGLIFYAMGNHMYEYKYVFDHVSDDLPMEYILSAFWEGQEGSFMLWMMWHVVLGWILIKRGDGFEAPVLAVFAFTEIWLSSMLLGIYVPFETFVDHIGSNPMVLLRESTIAPIFSNANYLDLIEGRGLNPALQNYWNVIHPPTLFLGFAGTLVPFAYAFAGLWTGDHQGWLKPAQKWALFSAGFLGVGILMGSFWAYEALSFGGYWSWDPVENTSFVPWIIMVGGVHANLIANSTGRAIRSTYLFYLASFLLIVYSTTLTRSGILGDTSAHAFTEMGLEWQLAGFLLSFIAIVLFAFFYRMRSIPSPKSEESIYSREFWMFIGAMVFAFSGFLIDLSSSLPVYNTIVSYFNPEFVGKVIKDPIAHYNKYQLWISVAIGILAGSTIFLRYKEPKKNINPALKRLGAHALISIALVLGFKLWVSVPTFSFLALSFASFFAISASLDYLIFNVKNNKGVLGAGLSHMGFGLMCIGLISSGLNSYHLNNPFLFRGLSAEEGFEEKYIQLIKGRPLLVRGHLATYVSDTTIGREKIFHINFQQIDDSLNVINSFDTYPTALYANDFSKIATLNPDTRHEFGKDIFTCIVNLPSHIMDAEEARKMEDSLKYEDFQLILGESVELKEGTLTIEGVNTQPKHSDYLKSKNDVGIEVEYSFVEEGKTEPVFGRAALGIDGSLVYTYAGVLEPNGIRVRVSDKLINNFMSLETDLDYTELKIKKGQTIEWNEYSLTLSNLSQSVSNPSYEMEEGDIAVQAEVLVAESGKSNNAAILQPVYVIRGNRPVGFKDFSPDLRLHIRLSEINPQSEIFTLKIAKEPLSLDKLPLQIAQDVPRSDYLILEAKVFPGINYYWLGCILMMGGLLFSWLYKRYRKSNA